MHDKLFDNQNAIMVENLKQYAVDIGLQADSFNACLDSGKYAEEINKDLEDGKKAGVTGTPSFYIGKTKGKEKEVLGKKITGARPYASFKQVIDQLLTEPAKQN
jgi:predicted DsbA family dithiol-disulfide isomerase